MADPVLHEPTIMDTLDCAPCAVNAGRLQAAAMMSLVDAYDRKLERESFVVLAHAALHMHSNIDKLRMMASIAEYFKAGTLDEILVAQAVAGCERLSTNVHTELRRLMERVVSCPTSADQVH